MMKFKLTHEDGDYQVFHSTNHADPDRIGTIVVDHALPGSAEYAAFVEDQEREIVSYDDQRFFDSWDKAQRYLETICSMTIKIGPSLIFDEDEIVTRAARADELA